MILLGRDCGPPPTTSAAALVEAEQAVRPDRLQLVRGRLLLDDDRHAAEALAEDVGQGIEGRNDERREGVVLGRRVEHGRMVTSRGLATMDAP